MNQGVLYISYDGMLEPLGQSQVLAYLEKLAPGRRIHLISFEKPNDWRDEAQRKAVGKRIADAGIHWHPMRYHKSPSTPATAYDVMVGSACAIAIAQKHRLGIVHARSYVAALIALAVKRLTGAKFLFDMRGLWADERVDGGLWPRDGRLYRMTKALERRFILAADQVVTLTHASASEIRCFDYLAHRSPPIEVIPTCADLDRFSIQGPPALNPFVLGYVGSVGTWYLLDEMLHCFRLLQATNPSARLLIVNRNEQEMIRTRALEAGIDPGSIDIVAADHQDIHEQIARMTAAMALIKPCYSKIASAPTKLAEYLGCGVPCLGNSGVGDVAEMLEGKQVGVAIDGFSDKELSEAVGRLRTLATNPETQRRCRAVAEELFSLDGGVAAYDSLYRSLALPDAGAR